MPDDTHLIDQLASALAREPGASMQEIATAAGVGRTTLHRAFGSRDALIEQVGRHVLAECARLFDEAGIDDAPPAEALERMLDATLPLARVHALLLSEPAVYRATALTADIERQDERLERFFARGQRAGVFRPDLPPRWLAYSIGSQLTAAWWAVHDGYVGARDAQRLLRATIVEGLAGPALRSGDDADRP